MFYQEKDRLISIYRTIVKVVFAICIIATIVVAFTVAHHDEYSTRDSFGYWHTQEGYTDTKTVLIYLGCGAVISAIELLGGLLICDFLDNINFIAHKIDKITMDMSKLDYYDKEAKAMAKAVINELTTDTKVKEMFGRTEKDTSE